MGPRPSLDIGTRVAAGRLIVVPRGELDAGTAPDLAAVLAAAQDRAALLVLDLRELNFMDSSGLSVVLAAANGGSRDTRTAFFAVPGRRRVQRLFELTGTVDRIAWLATPEAAPAAD